MKHEISFSLPSRPLKNVDAEFEVKVDNKLLGRLKVSKGSLDWTPNGYDDENPYRIKWVKFDEYMKDNTKRKKK